MNQFWMGEELDEEMRVKHLICAIFHLSALVVFTNHGLGTDDRSKIGLE